MIGSDAPCSFEILEMRLRVLVQNHSRVYQIGGIEDSFYLSHQAERRSTPLLLDKGRHISSGAMLRLQTSVVFLRDESNDILHQVVVATVLFGAVEVLAKYKMHISCSACPKMTASL